jgi:hypothetical protein
MPHSNAAGSISGCGPADTELGRNPSCYQYALLMLPTHARRPRASPSYPTRSPPYLAPEGRLLAAAAGQAMAARITLAAGQAPGLHGRACGTAHDHDHDPATCPHPVCLSAPGLAHPREMERPRIGTASDVPPLAASARFRFINRPRSRHPGQCPRRKGPKPPPGCAGRGRSGRPDRVRQTA